MPAPSLITAIDKDRESEIAAEITKNSGISFVFHDQNFANPSFMFCVNVSCVIRKI